jgi:hypothetical protein
MALPTKPVKEPRPIAVTVRLSIVAVEQLKVLAKDHNLSQADVIEHLIHEEYMKHQSIVLKEMKEATQRKKK